MNHDSQKIITRQKIFSELKRNNIRAGCIWRFQTYYYYLMKLSDHEKVLFNIVLQELCEENFFEPVPYMHDNYHYKLTEYGNTVVWM